MAALPGQCHCWPTARGPVRQPAGAGGLKNCVPALSAAHASSLLKLRSSASARRHWHSRSRTGQARAKLDLGISGASCRQPEVPEPAWAVLGLGQAMVRSKRRAAGTAAGRGTALASKACSTTAVR